MQDAEVLKALDTLRRAGGNPEIIGFVLCAVVGKRSAPQNEILVAVHGLSDENARRVLETASEISEDDKIGASGGAAH